MTEYKRLIKELGQDDSETKYNCENCEFISSDCKEGNKWCDASMCHRAVEKRLAELEDKIGSGRIMEMTCKVGDTLYWVDMFGFDYGIKEVIVESIFYDKDGIKIYVHGSGFFWGYRIGESLFTNKPAAKARLKELQEKQK